MTAAKTIRQERPSNVIIRDWLGGINAMTIELPEGTFKEAGTGVATVMMDSVRDDDILATLEKEDRVSRYAACDANHECHLRVVVQYRNY